MDSPKYNGNRKALYRFSSVTHSGGKTKSDNKDIDTLVKEVLNTNASKKTAEGESADSIYTLIQEATPEALKHILLDQAVDYRSLMLTHVHGTDFLYSSAINALIRGIEEREGCKDETDWGRQRIQGARMEC